MTKLHTCFPSSASSKLGIDGGSHMISKLKPTAKIRIIHIYPPEIIQTDAANFRELVQRLTGKPEVEKTPPTKDLMKKEQEFLGLKNGNGIKNEVKESEEEEKEEDKEDDEIWRRSRSNERFSGFLGEFSELDVLWKS